MGKNAAYIEINFFTYPVYILVILVLARKCMYTGERNTGGMYVQERMQKTR